MEPIDIAEEIAGQPRPVAYSYVRFSTAVQHLGDSLRRQVEGAREYCQRHSLELHETSYRDLGVSAFKRKNIERGALAAFIEAVKSGKVQKGSYLIIEQFDRLSRADIDIALELLLHLVRSGIRVVTLSDEKVWDRVAVKEVGNLILAIVYMSRANNESAAKSDRLTKMWGEKKRRAATGDARRIVTSECPRWLQPNEDKTGFIVLGDRVESIKKVFEMRIGGHGIVSIMRRANQEQWPIPGKAPVRKSGESLEDFGLRAALPGVVWHESTVSRLLHNRALLGEYQPHQNDPSDEDKRIAVGEPIQGYYPAVLDEVTFLRAQAKADRSGRFPGRRDASMKNWLQGLLRCNCGHSMVRKSKDSKAQPGYARYYCTARNRGTSGCDGVSAPELENAVLAVVSQVAPAYFEGTARQEQLKSQVDLLALDVSAATHARNRYAEAVKHSSLALDVLLPRLEAAEVELRGKASELEKARAELADLDGDFDSVFANIVRAVRDIDSLDARARLREDLSRVMEKVVVHQVEGYIQVYLRAEKLALVHPLRADAQLPHMQSAIAADDTRTWTEI